MCTYAHMPGPRGTYMGVTHIHTTGVRGGVYFHPDPGGQLPVLDSRRMASLGDSADWVPEGRASPQT
jgi:hypothetical protein